ncbi:MAG: T9SS type A sorting domain-containing protein, partial [Bacteroidia bacterium]|nr:T9SS type A sorting domain-containing protein [Bacteroidia bacterium]
LYPNPNKGAFSLKTTGLAGAANIEVYDATGRTVFISQCDLTGSDQISLTLPGVASGLYWVKLHAGGRAYTVKMTVE